MDADGSLLVRFDVTNTGERDGEEVAQLYVRQPVSRVPRPLEALEGFRRVALAPGATEHVELLLRAAQLGFWDAERKAFVVEPGVCEIRVGGSSADIQLTKTVAVRP
jgi:beta-glucosidase